MNRFLPFGEVPRPANVQLNIENSPNKSWRIPAFFMGGVRVQVVLLVRQN